ncbi:lysoplasmalogenase [Cognataquiflexum rubidum]|uniref:lysoplasmalogenase n=1 Tax=Cognataquiflexum rubidum TaxID=2922273 RepID=UPI001F12AFDC|nr:lysoplasmalogenase [Cognataquiflexum rubidum]MCH6234102.1 lysoplasmalogenase [Cognataquiflexum rubidum]
MKNKKMLWLYLFLFAGIIDIVFTANGENSTRIFTKPLILIALWGFFIFSSTTIKGTILRKSMSAALIFCWMGDVLLMFPDMFLYGLGAFLMAHICYIIGFKMAQTNPFAIGKVDFVRLLLINLPIYIAASFVYFLINPGLGSIKVPVVIYLIVIVLMVTTARERYGKTNAVSFWQVFIGGAFFMVSDGVLAINRFYQSFPESGVIVMGTYIIAQFLIVKGILAHFQNDTN